MAPAAGLVPNFSKPAPKSNPPSTFSALACGYAAAGLGCITSVFFLLNSSC